jgi:hypothetical protein
LHNQNEWGGSLRGFKLSRILRPRHIHNHYGIFRVV